jgi:hypothetical protein
VPPTDYKRESVYLSDREQAALQQLTRQFNTSKNGVVRILIREAAGLPLPDEYLQQLRDAPKVTLQK